MRNIFRVHFSALSGLLFCEC